MVEQTPIALIQPFSTVAQRVAQWRREHGPHARMPAALWRAAVALARIHGAFATARGVGVSYGGLTAHMKRAKPSFVDVGPAAELAQVGGAATGTVVELALRTGDRLTVRLAAGHPVDLTAVLAALRGPR